MFRIDAVRVGSISNFCQIIGGGSILLCDTFVHDRLQVQEMNSWPIFHTPFSRKAGMVWRRAALVTAGAESPFCLI